MSRQYLWVVEIFDAGAWLPTYGVAFTRVDARDALARWREDNPDDQFRLRRYIADVAR